MKRRLLLAVACLSAPSPLFACPVCFQVEAGPVASGVRAAVVVLMCVTVCVLGAVAMFLRRTGLLSDTTGTGLARASETRPLFPES
jgi:hypothetical protein